MYLIALLWSGSAIPSTGWTHLEGIEAADPATPAAVLRLDIATARYTGPDAARMPWRAQVDATNFPAAAEPGAEAHPGHAGAAQHTPATTEQ